MVPRGTVPEAVRSMPMPMSLLDLAPSFPAHLGVPTDERPGRAFRVLEDQRTRS